MKNKKSIKRKGIKKYIIKKALKKGKSENYFIKIEENKIKNIRAKEMRFN